MYEVSFSDRFRKDLQKLLKKNYKIKNKLSKQLRLLAINPKYKSLRVHKLNDNSCWSLSIDMSIRVLFSKRGKKILCIRIGTHDEVY